MKNNQKLFKKLTFNAVLILIFVNFSFTCSHKEPEPDYGSELTYFKNEAKKKLSADIEEFNGYKDRPESDGPYNSKNNSDFLLENTPYFLSSDENFTEVYNYRWWMVTKHLRSRPERPTAKCRRRIWLTWNKKSSSKPTSHR